MDIPQSYIDLLRAAHLFCFAAGMGTALFFDFQSIRSLKKPIELCVIADLERIHLWIVCAFAGLWVTGLALIYVRTGFDLSAFSPKLWLKVGLMVLMTGNSLLIGAFILPLMRNSLNRTMSSLPIGKFAAATQVAIVSMFCWSSGIALGSSVVLKTAPWDVLVPLAVGWFIVMTVGGQGLMMVLRVVPKRDESAPAQPV